MSRIGLFIFAIAVCGVVLPVECGLLTGLVNLDAKPENEQATEDIPATTEGGTEKEVCFDILGCFSLERPWRTPLRPIPAPKPPEEIPVTLMFFTRPNIYEEYTITTFPNVDLGGAPFDPSKPTAIITHGYTKNGSTPWMHDLKDAYLGKVDANVMITDWGPGAQNQNYLQVTGNARVVGRVIARTLKYLMDNYGLDPKKVHLIGHSLGAQISSYVGKELPGIGRLTALDPAQPAFEGYDKEVRLDKTDAEFVDVIHTDAKPFIPTLGFGMVQPHGHVDFYVNGGFEQPGCIVPENIPKIKGLLDLAKYSYEYINEIKSCNHGRAHQYLIEAFNETDSCIFWGHKATAHMVAKAIAHSFTQALLPNVTALSSTCHKDDCVPLGFATPQSPLRGAFVITTNNVSPYCIPEQGVSPEGPSAGNSSNKPQSPLSAAAALAVQTVGKFGHGIANLVSLYKN